MTAIELCRTAALGGHVEQCDSCGHQRISLQFVPIEKLPKVPIAGARAVDGGSSSRTARYAVLPRRLHASPTRSPSSPTRTSRRSMTFCSAPRPRPFARSLPIPRTWGPRSASSRILHTWGQNLLHPSPPALRRPWWRHLAGRPAMGRLPARLLPSGPGAVPPLPPVVSARSGEGLPGRQAGVLLILAARSTNTRLSCATWLPVRTRRMGGLLQAAVRRAAAGAGLHRALHAPYRHLQQPPALASMRQGSFPLEGLPERQSTWHDDPHRRGIHPPLLAPRPARGFQRIRYYGFLVQSLSGAKAGALP